VTQKLPTLGEVERTFIDAAWDPARWPEALTLVSQGLGAAGCAILPIKGTTPATAWSPSIDELAHGYFHEGWYLRDQRSQTIPKLLTTGVAIDYDGITPDAMRRNDFYQDYLGKLGFMHYAGLRIDAGDDIWALSLQRRSSEAPFSAAEQRRIATWGRRLSNAATLSVEVSKTRGRALTELFASLGKPALLLDRFGHVVEFNEVAQGLMPETLLIRRQKLQLHDRRATEALDDAIGTMLRPASGLHTFGPILVRQEFRPALAISLTALWGQPATPFARARLLVLVNDLGARPLAKAEQLSRAFGLTPGEAQLAAALSSGTSLQDAADELGIGNETARTRLKGVFAKTGVNRQTALIALIARFVS
jgi:DNA-binding CsgD family transcriptional regulator